MSGPLASTIAMQSGVAQSVIAPQAPDKKESKKKVEQEEAKKGEKAEQTEQGPAGFGKAAPEEKVKVRRKRVRLKDVAERQVASFSQANSKEAQKSGKSQAKATTAQAETASTAPTRDLGYTKAVSRLMQQGLLTQSSVKFEQRKQELDNSPLGNILSPKGQQRWMVNSLINMISICVDQHTGGKAGEVYTSRRDNRMVLMALRGLRDGDKQESTSTGRGISKGEFSLKQRQATSLLSCIVGPTSIEEHPYLSEVA